MTRVALVSGAARGIGAACVARLVADGWRVALDRCADDPAIAYRLAAQADLDAVIDGTDGAAVPVIGDVRDRAANAAAVAEAMARFGRLDAVVASAGVVGGGGPIWEMDDATWAAIVDTDLTGVFNLVRAAMPHILASPAGRVVTIASAAGSLGLRHMAAYSTAKHGVIGLTRSLAADLAGTGVTANAVAPGSTRTPILHASATIYGLDDPERFVRHQEPLGRLIEPAEVAATVAWLCSEDAAAITGAVVAVDGGMTATP